MSAHATHIYHDGPDDKPNAKHLVTLVKPNDALGNFWTVALADGREEIVHRQKLRPVATEQEGQAS